MGGQGRAQQSGIHRSTHYLITEAGTPGTWHYSFFIGDRNFAGKVQAVLGLLAARRVRMKIDRLLKHNASMATHTDAAVEPDVSQRPPPPIASDASSTTFPDSPELAPLKAEASSTVAFTCEACKFVYEAVQVRAAARGVFRCTACWWPVHRWDGEYDYKGWRRLEKDVEPPPPLVPPADPEE